MRDNCYNGHTVYNFKECRQTFDRKIRAFFIHENCFRLNINMTLFDFIQYRNSLQTLGLDTFFDLNLYC